MSSARSPEACENGPHGELGTELAPNPTDGIYGAQNGADEFVSEVDGMPTGWSCYIEGDDA